MRTKRTFGVLAVLALVASLILGGVGVSGASEELELAGAVGTAFTYQGQLQDGNGPINAICDLQFSLWDALAGGSRVGSAILLNSVLLQEGQFTARLDFGAAAFQGQARWLEVAVSCPAGTAYVTLDPRQELTGSPYALYALAAPWAGLIGVPGGFGDGVDNDTIYGAGTGLTLSSGQYHVNFAGSGVADTVSRSDHHHDAAYVNEGQANSVSTAMVQNGTLLLEDLSQNGCGPGQVIKWNGSAWACAADQGGSDAWSLSGNAGTTAGTHYLGTSDNQALELKVNGGRVLRLEPASSPNLLGGYSGNQLTAGVAGATVGGGGGSGSANRVTDSWGTVGGGLSNRAGDNVNTVDDARFATVGGGYGNTAGRESATVAGGYGNQVIGVDGTVGGGYQNHANGGRSTVSGGSNNEAIGSHATVGGGGDNGASGEYATIGGGGGNSTDGSSTTVGGGTDNVAIGDYATVGGGGANDATALSATVAGGFSNAASDYEATVGGGMYNTASGGSATVSGGFGNVASGWWATIPGGTNNSAEGDYSLAAGHKAQALHEGAFVWADSTDTGFASDAEDQFLVRAGGGVKIVRGRSIFAPSHSALQVEQAEGFEAGWFYTADTANPYAVLKVAKDPAAPGNFVDGADRTSSGAETGRFHIDKNGTYVAGSDFAEALPVAGDLAEYEAGDVLVISLDRPGGVEKCSQPYDGLVVGVYSTRPGFLGADKEGTTEVAEDEVPVAVLGIVPVKVTDENGPVQPGDLLTTSSAAGHAMRCDGLALCFGRTLGKALEGLPAGQHTGVIQVLVSLQ